MTSTLYHHYFIWNTHTPSSFLETKVPWQQAWSVKNSGACGCGVYWPDFLSMWYKLGSFGKSYLQMRKCLHQISLQTSLIGAFSWLVIDMRGPRSPWARFSKAAEVRQWVAESDPLQEDPMSPDIGLWKEASLRISDSQDCGVFTEESHSKIDCVCWR